VRSVEQTRRKSGLYRDSTRLDGRATAVVAGFKKEGRAVKGGKLWTFDPALSTDKKDGKKEWNHFLLREVGGKE